MRKTDEEEVEFTVPEHDEPDAVNLLRATIERVQSAFSGLQERTPLKIMTIAFEDTPEYADQAVRVSTFFDQTTRHFMSHFVFLRSGLANRTMDEPGSTTKRFKDWHEAFTALLTQLTTFLTPPSDRPPPRRSRKSN